MYCRLSTCLCVKQVSGPRSVFRLPESSGNDATEELASALAKYKNTSKQIHNIVNGAFLNKGLSLSQCYRIVETVKKGKSLEEMKDQRNKNPTKTWRTVEDRVLGHKLYQSLAASSLQSRFGSCRLFSLLENKEWPGWCFYHPWDLQDGAGTGSTKYRRKWVYRSLPEMATLPWKVHCPPGWICREILKNKVPPISYSFCFIGPFAFVIEHTSYVIITAHKKYQKNTN